MLAALRTLPRTVWLIGLISLLNDSASDMLYPLLPLYLSSVLLAGPRALGLIEGIAEASASLLKLVSGVMVDRSRRSKPWLLCGYGLAGLGRPLIAVVGSWPWLLAIRFADRVGKGLRSSPRDALLAASVAPQQRGLAFGLHRAMDNAGAVIGPLLASALLAWQVPLQSIFLWSALPAALCLALVCWLREPPRPAPAVAARNWRLQAMPPPLRRYLLVLALFTLGNSSNMFLLLHAQRLGVPAAQIPLLWAAVSAVAMLFSTPLAALSDRVGRVPLLLGGYVLYGLFYLAFGLQSQPGWPLYALFAGYGLFMAATEGVEKALLADLAPVDARGSAFGWFHLTSGLCLLPASLLFGYLYQAGSPLLAFGFAAACALLAAGLLWRWLGPHALPLPAASTPAGKP
ncbi:MFS transporter [Vogesella facilis]|uniref:MFS transporter n=1 Tax=Vogesella facilis TaxID=1655232 RepID=A0ABV7REQ5_9NEIS